MEGLPEGDDWFVDDDSRRFELLQQNESFHQ